MTTTIIMMTTTTTGVHKAKTKDMKKRAYQKYKMIKSMGITLIGWLYAIGFYIAQTLSITNPKLR